MFKCQIDFIVAVKKKTVKFIALVIYLHLITDFNCISIHAIYRDTCYPVINLFDGMSNTENAIHVTGFGVFRGFTEKNPSWQAVSQLPDYITHNGQPIAIVKHEIPVTYVAVDQKVQEIWSSKPKLVIHCGVHSKADKICLEKNAFNGNFREEDYTNKLPQSCRVSLPNGGAECEKLCTAINLKSIMEEVDVVAPMKCSNHPGNYLCGYLYLKSLDADRTRSLFIHVPSPRENCTITDISDAILSVVKHCVKQLDQLPK